jgi:hypothetical protein
MNKKLLFLLVLVFVSTTLLAQKSEVVFPKLPMDDKNELVTYSKVVNLTGTTADELYHRGKKWFFSYFKNPAEKIRTDDSLKKEIEGFIRFKLMVPDKKGVVSDVTTIQYSLFMTFKDGRYKYTITNINEKSVSNLGIELWIPTLPAGKNAAPADAEKHAQWLTFIDKEIKATIDAMEKGVADKGEQKKEDW